MGFIYGLLSSAAFGLIPLFALPLIHGGMPAPLVLFYRFSIAALVLGGILILRGERFHTSARSLCLLAGMSVMYAMAALLMFWGFAYMPSGVAATLQFLYPVMVMLLMIVFFHERFSWITAGAVALALLGVHLLGGGAGGRVQPVGVALLLVSALCNAIYITAIFAARIPHMSGLVMTFYVLALGGLLSLANCLATVVFRPLRSWRELGLALLLAVITAVISNLTLILAVQRIGSTLASVLGVMEPLTAVLVGVCVFHEPFTPPIAGGVAFIVASVILVLLGDKLRALGVRLHRRPQ